MSFRSMLDLTMDVYTKTRQKDAVRGSAVQTAKTYDTVPCALQIIEGDERDVGGRIGSVSTHIVFCEMTFSGASLSITRDMTIIISGISYDVELVIKPRNHHQEIEVKEIK